MVLSNEDNQWPSGLNDGFSIQRSSIQNNWVAQVHSAFPPSESNQMSARRSWGLCSKK